MSELVDKQAVLRAISELSFAGYLNADDIHDAVEWLPVVEERKKGKWEMIWHFFFHAEVPICSQCRKVSPFKTNFCPNCGADMREEKN